MARRPLALPASLAAGALAAGALAATAAAARPARPAEAHAIARAATAGLDTTVYRAVRPRVSTRSRFWSTIRIVPRPGHTNLEGAYAVLVRIAAGPWAVVDLGTAGVACGIAPTSVLRDLGLALECAPRERI